MIRPTYELRYNGLLSRDVCEAVIDAARRNPYAIEMKCFPVGLNGLFDDRTYTRTGEDCMGIERTETRQGLAYGWISKNFATPGTTGFLMLPDNAAVDRVVKFLPDLVIDADPFKMALIQAKVEPVDPVRRLSTDTLIFGCGILCGVLLRAVFG